MKRREKGQGLVEYAIILALVAYVMIAVARLVGPKVSSYFDEINVDVSTLSIGIPSSLTQHANKRGGDELDSYKEFKDRSLYQEEALNEAKQQLQEALGETFEVLSEYALGIGDDGLYELVIQAQQAASGDYSGLQWALEEVFVALGETQTELQVSVIKKVEPNVINSYWELDGTQVPYELFEAALQDIEQYPSSTDETISLMWEVWDLVEQRNSLIGELQPALLTGACYGITGLKKTEIPANIELAEWYEAQLPPSSCDN